MPLRAALLGVICLTVPTTLVAQSAMPEDDVTTALPIAEAVPVSESITLDGRLDEAVWQDAPPITRFTQTDPNEGRPVTQPTRVRLIYDQHALYVGAVLRDTAAISTRLARRDSHMEDSDWFSVSLDSYDDNLTAYRFEVNPSGVRRDEKLSGGSTWHGDNSWDPVWEASTTVTDSGWVVEMRIPFSQLRFSGASHQHWGIQLERTIARRQEQAVFAFTPRSEPGGIARYGRLEGLENLQRDRGLELLPYVLARGSYGPVDVADDVTFANPFRDGSEYSSSTGLNLKYRLASNMTLDAAVNPDFGQVEVDPAVVNLTAYETRFEEKRPFFVEGSDIFQFGGGGGHHGPGGGGTQLLYSRRIGARPQGDVPDDAVYSSRPDASTILGAAKLTGLTAGGWSVGVLEAVTAQEKASYVDANDVTGSTAVAPLANYFVGRVQRHMRAGQTVVGAMATAVNRRLSAPALVDQFRGSAYTGGVDFRYEWAAREWSVSGYLAGSRIAGDSTAMEAAQTSSARYYQRPDASYLRLDSAATSLAGYTGRISISKDAGLHWRGNARVSATSPGFEANDLGYQRDADRASASASLRYEENRPGPVFRQWNIDGGPDATWNYGGDFLGASMDLGTRLELLSYWTGDFNFSHDFPGYDDRLTRGGPLTRGVTRDRASFRLESDSRKPWSLRLNTSYEWDAAGSTQAHTGLRLELRPSSAWNISVGPSWQRTQAAAQYVESVEDPLATATYGQRYLFAHLDQTTVSMETRLNVTFRPGLTIQVYAQPFLASGDFSGLKELRAPGTFSFLRYGVDTGTISLQDGEYIIDPDGPGPAQSFTLDNEDFNRRSLRGNAVLRWQWRPGSTLFLVWQQSRSDYTDLNDLRLGRDTRALLGIPPDNVFVLKISYWLNP
ncbi:MAG: DUF5916 domain-containing protein [Gemmatimonadota bacterium]